MENKHNPSSPLLEKLGVTFKWEARMLYFVATGVPVSMIHQLTGWAIGGLSVILVIVMDTIFSVLITALFLRPINEVLEEGKGVANQSKGYKSMQNSKWLTLIGCTLAVGSSTLMYFNLLLYFAFQGLFHRSPWLHPNVFSIPWDSILNDVGMFFVCGVLKTVPPLTVLYSRLFSTATVHATGGPQPALRNEKGELVIDSKAYD